MTSKALQWPARRDFLKAAGVGMITLSAACQSRKWLAVADSHGPYGPLAAVRDNNTGLELLQLPAGFQYCSYAWHHDEMSNAAPGPGHHDGMAVVAEREVHGLGREITLIRNHESSLGRLIDALARYDTAHIDSGSSRGHPAGGATRLIFRGHEWVEARPALGGTLVNCSGGPTPWGTWLTCEETLVDLTSQGGKKHGYVFEVCADPAETTGKPIVGMGRMKHEAAAVDPETNIVYLTEDHRNLSGLYRYVPFERSGRTGSLERGGQLQSARVKGIPNADLNVAYVGQMFELEWVSIADPDADPGAYSDATVTDTASGPFLQARNQGCLRMARGEGLWHHAGKLFIVDTATGRDIIGRRGRGQGALWILDLGTMRLSAHFVSDHWSAASHPDNVTVSPRGAVVLTEDCDGAKQQLRSGERLVAMTPDGQCYPFCRNNVTLTADDVAAAGKSVQPGDYRGREFTGVCFDSSGQFMFVNIQTPGITLAIWGPWERGNL